MSYYSIFALEDAAKQKTKYTIQDIEKAFDSGRKRGIKIGLLKAAEIGKSILDREALDTAQPYFKAFYQLLKHQIEGEVE